jgi:uncharacterized membrane protein
MLTSLAVSDFVFPLHLEYLSWPAALGIFAGLGVVVALLGMRSLNGLGPVRKWVAISIRLAVLLLFILIIGGARWQRVNKTVEVIVLRDTSESMSQVKDFPAKTLQESQDEWFKKLSSDKNAGVTMKRPEDRFGIIGFNSAATIEAMPNAHPSLDARPIREAGNSTDLSAALNTAMATMGRDAMHRLMIISDGNFNTGDYNAAIDAAVAQNIPIDVVPASYDVRDEVLVERFVTPAQKRENEPFTISVVLKSTNPQPVSGRLTVLHGGAPMDLDPYTEGVQATRRVTLKPGPNVERVLVPALAEAGVHQFKAIFEGENVSAEIAGAPGAGGAAGQTQVATTQRIRGDTIQSNNVAEAFTFVKGKGKVLYIDNVEGGRGQILREALAREGIILDDKTSVDQFPNTVVELQNYDAVILANVPRGAGGLTDDQQRMLATYVHDMGGGLVMIGGPDTFGAGGWQGSKLEEVLPVNMDIPAQRQLPKGALVLAIHSCEMPDGNYWGEQCAIKAAETLSERDELGVISYNWNGPGGGGSNWEYPLQTKGDGARAYSAIKKMVPGDMPSFDDMLDLAVNGRNGVGGLLKSDARQKHIIVISDGDPQQPAQSLINQCKANKISISTVAVYPHDVSDRGLPPTMRKMAQDTGGRAYGPINNNPNQLPQIFIKEATVVRRSLIHEPKEGIPLQPHPGTSDIMKGLEGVELPPLLGMVLTSKKNNPQIEVPLTAGAAMDPIFAHWQTGLGKAAAFTGDAHNRWAANWVGSPIYSKFWAQVVRGVSRPPMSTDFDVTTVQAGNTGHITVEALNKDNRFLNFLNVSGTVVGPDGKPRTVRLVQTGPGTYAGDFDAKDPGTYAVVLNYAGPKGENGYIPSGMAVNSSPELRDLRSNEAVLKQIAERTKGRVLTPFEAKIDLFNREGLKITSSPLPIWDLLVPILLALILVDVATRRIAWDWASTKKMAGAAAERVRAFTVVRKVESRQTLDALKRVREDVAEQKFRPAEQAGAAPVGAGAAPDPKAKFHAKGVEGDISKLVGGASDKPMPAAPKKIEPKGAPADGGGHTGSLLEAKRRAQQQIKQKEQGE